MWVRCIYTRHIRTIRGRPCTRDHCACDHWHSDRSRNEGTGEDQGLAPILVCTQFVHHAHTQCTESPGICNRHRHRHRWHGHAPLDLSMTITYHYDGGQCNNMHGQGQGLHNDAPLYTCMSIASTGTGEPGAVRRYRHTMLPLCIVMHACRQTPPGHHVGLLESSW